MFFDNFFKKPKKYISCPWIEYGMDFDLGVYGSNVKLCCYLSAPGGGNAMIFKDYYGEKIDWKKFFKIKNQYRKVQQSGKIIPECKGCVFLEKKEWEQKNEIRHIIFDHWTHCNCKCTYCYTEDDKKMYNELKTYNVLPLIKDMLNKNILKPGGAIGFGGGEPTMLEEFDELIDLLLDRGFSNIRVPSSGIKYSKIIEKGIKSGQLTVVVSVDSGFCETYKKIKQIDAFDTVCKNLIDYSKAQTKIGNVISKYILIPSINDSIKEIDAWLEFNRQNNILSIVIDIENSWMDILRTDPDNKVFELIKYVQNKSKEFGFIRCDICDRALHLLKEQP